MKILMFPWLAHGHITPFLKLAKKLTSPGRNIDIRVYLCSTRVNLEPIEQKPRLASGSIQLVELELASSAELPPHYHTTNGLPPHLVDTLKQTLHESGPRSFSKILETLKPDLVVYDFIQDWAPAIASSYSIPAVQFSIVSACFTSYFLHLEDGGGFPFPEIWMSDLEKSRIPLGVSTKERSLEATRHSNKIILVRTFREIEGKYLDHLGSQLSDKRMVATGPLVKEPDQEQEPRDGSEYDYISAWLDEKPALSTVFVSFGSEYFLTREEAEEVASGLELSLVDFVWVIRLPTHGPDSSISVESLVPEGFVQRVGKRGLMVEGWAPQARILANPSVGGFVSHCGWSSVLESMRLRVPIIAMPMQIDQPVNARLVASLGVGLEVKRDEHGAFRRDEIARVVAEVVVEPEGQDLRTRVGALSDLMLKKGDEEVDEVVNELVQICKEYGKFT